MIEKILEKRYKKQELTIEEINNLITTTLSNEAFGPAVGAFIMSTKFVPLKENEIINFVKASVAHCQKIKIKSKKLLIDKHSVGGIGDKFTFTFIPIFASLGFSVMKNSGTGLGLTGGTIDKVSSIPGFNSELKLDEVIDLVSKNNMVLFAHSKEFAKIDEIFYQIRNMLGLANIIEWVAISVMTKKLLINSELIMIDLKVGSGAFCKTMQIANKLAGYLTKIADSFGRKIAIIYSSMDAPLGYSIGNAVEIKEVIDFLKGEPNTDLATLLEVFVKRAAKEFPLTNFRVDQTIKDEKAYLKFAQLIKNQDGDLDLFLKEYDNNLAKMNKLDLIASNSGYFTFNKITNLGELSRQIEIIATSEHPIINPYSGIVFYKKNNEKILKGEHIGIIYSPKPLTKVQIKLISEVYSIGPKKHNNPTLILKVI